MKTLIIYDNADGYIYNQIQGYKVPDGDIKYIEVDSDELKNKIIKSVNTETKELVMEDILKLEIESERIEELQDNIINLTYENLILKIGEDNV